MPSHVLKVEEDIENYVKLDLLGEGSYGVVYKAQHKQTSEIVAMKQIRLQYEEQGIPHTTIREISLLQELRSPNVVKLISVSIQENGLYLIFEFVAMDLRKYLDAIPKNDYVPRETVQRFAFQICQAMCFIHQRGILHRDLKPQNLLVDEKGTIKVADLGLSRSISIPIRTYTCQIMTLWYRSPEILLGAKRYGAGIDVWAVGCVLAEIALKAALFKGDSEIDQLFQIFRLLGTPTEKQWHGLYKLPEFKISFPKWKKNELVERLMPFCDDRLVDLIQSMMKYDPSLRISMRNSLHHTYFDDVDTSAVPAGNYRGELLDPTDSE